MLMLTVMQDRQAQEGEEVQEGQGLQAPGQRELQ
jgi:hypothetical protein